MGSLIVVIFLKLFQRKPKLGEERPSRLMGYFGATIPRFYKTEIADLRIGIARLKSWKAEHGL